MGYVLAVALIAAMFVIWIVYPLPAEIRDEIEDDD